MIRSCTTTKVADDDAVRAENSALAHKLSGAKVAAVAAGAGSGATADAADVDVGGLLDDY